MKVNLTLHALLRSRRRDLTSENPVTTQATSVGELVAELDLSETEAAIVFVNGKRAGFAAAIGDGDEIKIFPLLGGG